MELPRYVPVMVLPETTLFPQAMLPLYIFELQYRRMLTDVLETHRMFAVAMRRPGLKNRLPCTVAGLGVVRAALRHPDGTAHLVLQGLTRIELLPPVNCRPYRLHPYWCLEDEPSRDVVVDALRARMRELFAERIKMGLPFPFASPPPAGSVEAPPPESSQSWRELLRCLDNVEDAGQVADFIASVVLLSGVERQRVLEAVNPEIRLRRVIRFLLSEIEHQRHREDHA